MKNSKLTALLILISTSVFSQTLISTMFPKDISDDQARHIVQCGVLRNQIKGLNLFADFENKLFVSEEAAELRFKDTVIQNTNIKVIDAFIRIKKAWIKRKCETNIYNNNQDLAKKLKQSLLQFKQKKLSQFKDASIDIDEVDSFILRNIADEEVIKVVGDHPTDYIWRWNIVCSPLVREIVKNTADTLEQLSQSGASKLSDAYINSMFDQSFYNRVSATYLCSLDKSLDGKDSLLVAASKPVFTNFLYSIVTGNDTED